MPLRWSDELFADGPRGNRPPRHVAARLLPVLLVLLFVRGNSAVPPEPTAVSPAGSERAIATHAEEFVRVALLFAQHAPEEVESYVGPASLRPPADAPHMPLATIAARTHRLVAHVQALNMAALRERRLLAQARALAAVIDQRVSGRRLSFDEEARLVYGVTLDGDATNVDAANVDATASADAVRADALKADTPNADTVDVRPVDLDAMNVDASRARERARQSDQLDRALTSIARMLPGTAPLSARVAAHRRRFVVPSDRRRAVFDAALRACRERTRAHWALPAGERLDVKWSISAPGAWHRYEGDGRSTLTINPAALEFLDAAVDLACHEGYPGHHAQAVIADRRLAARTEATVPVEESLVLLRSPASLLREGAANYAVDLAFPPGERLQFERDVLFPLAGLDPSTADVSAAVREQMRTLERAIAPILRAYRDGTLTAAAAADHLERRALVSNPQALLRFTDDLGAYVLGYAVMRDRIAAAHAETNADAWRMLHDLLVPPDPHRLDRFAMPDPARPYS